ncbi:HutD family protein [Pseudarthrobacter sulfonivorans]|uniref:HutD family protein n=1 Tax=Pseudarthrobacter sulfonivorans TaxID=121292 RepID=UPI0037CA15B3
MFQAISYAPTEYARMPWKNRGGHTTELLRGGPREKYTWRLSIADIGVDGPFSRFVGMQRIITVIQGNGVRLNLGGRSNEVLAPFQTLSFDGSSDVQCELLNGPVKDINLIYSPAHISPRWEWTEQGQPRDFSASADTTLVYSPESETAVTSTRFSPIDLPAGHLLEITNTPEPETFTLQLAGSRCLIIALTTLESQPTTRHF